VPRRSVNNPLDSHFALKQSDDLQQFLLLLLVLAAGRAVIRGPQRIYEQGDNLRDVRVTEQIDCASAGTDLLELGAVLLRPFHLSSQTLREVPTRQVEDMAGVQPTLQPGRDKRRGNLLDRLRRASIDGDNADAARQGHRMPKRA